MKILFAAMLAIVVSACGLDPSVFKDDRFFRTKDVFEKHEQNLHLTDIKP